MRKRVLASMLTFCMVLTLVPTSVLAVESTPETVIEETTVDEDTSILEADLPEEVSVDKNAYTEAQEAEGDDLQESKKEEESSDDEDDNDSFEKAEDEVDNPDDEENDNEIARVNTEMEKAADAYSGSCGENVTWELFADNVLVISGMGAMEDYGEIEVTDTPSSYGLSVSSGDQPWYKLRHEIEKVIIEPGVTSVGDCAFNGCDNLTSVTLPDGLKSIGISSFGHCSSLIEINLPDSLLHIKAGAFNKCKELNARIPDHVTEIGVMAFGYTAITDLVIPGSVSVFGCAAFTGCDNLKKVTIMDGVTIIRNHTFSYCESLTDIFIPKSVICIEFGAFNWCNNLKDVYYGGNEDGWNNIERSHYDDPSGNDNTPQILNQATIHYDDSKDEDDANLENFNVDYFDTIAQVGVNIDLSWSWNDLLTGNSSVYNQNLAEMGLVLSAAIEGSTDAAEKILLNNLGCDEAPFRPTSPSAIFAHKTLIKRDGTKKHVIFVVLRGTTEGVDLANDILSGLNSGDWGVNSVYSELNTYLSNWSNEYGEINSNNTKIFVTGHSLGGACANIVAAKLSDVYGKDNVFGYTFATPSPTTIKPPKDYYNIYNFLCDRDNVPSRLSTQDPWCGYGYYTWFSPDKSPQTSIEYFNLTEKLWSETYDANFLFRLHAPSIYMAFLKTSPDLNNIASDVNYIRAKCPVNIEVYNSNGELVGHIVNDEVDYDNYTSDVMLTVTDGAKCVYFLNDDTYTINFIGTGGGTMVYTAASKNMNSDIVEDYKVYSDVNITNGKKLKSIVSSYDETNTNNLVEIPDVELLVTDEDGNAIARVLSDNEASSSGEDNGTEIPIDDEGDSGEDEPSDDSEDNPGDNPGNKPGNGSEGNKPENRPNGNSSNNNSSIDTSSGNDKFNSNSTASSIINSSIKAVVETWKPTTPDEKKRYACMGKEAVQYTLSKDNAYRIVIENAMQGPMCFKSFEAVLGEYKIGRTYNVYTLPDAVYSMDKEITFTIKIPSDIYKKAREYKMICVTKGGQPIIYNDLVTNPETITVKTDKFYAYALIYK